MYQQYIWMDIIRDDKKGTGETGSFFVPVFGLLFTEVSLKQTCECFSVSCFVLSHLISHFASLVTSKNL